MPHPSDTNTYALVGGGDMDTLSFGATGSQSPALGIFPSIQSDVCYFVVATQDSSLVLIDYYYSVAQSGLFLMTRCH